VHAEHWYVKNSVMIALGKRGEWNMLSHTLREAV
jgi:hypothetical protein